MKHYYAISHTMYSLDDSDTKIRNWNTATVWQFDSKTQRDEFCDGELLCRPISAKRAYSIGFSNYAESEREHGTC